MTQREEDLSKTCARASPNRPSDSKAESSPRVDAMRAAKGEVAEKSEALRLEINDGSRPSSPRYHRGDRCGGEPSLPHCDCRRGRTPLMRTLSRFENYVVLEHLPVNIPPGRQSQFACFGASFRANSTPHRFWANRRLVAAYHRPATPTDWLLELAWQPPSSVTVRRDLLSPLPSCRNQSRSPNFAAPSTAASAQAIILFSVRRRTYPLDQPAGAFCRIVPTRIQGVGS